MKAKFYGIEIDGTPEEMAELIKKMNIGFDLGSTKDQTVVRYVCKECGHWCSCKWQYWNGVPTITCSTTNCVNGSCNTKTM